jgi:hypothetical protein
MRPLIFEDGPGTLRQLEARVAQILTGYRYEVAAPNEEGLAKAVDQFACLGNRLKVLSRGIVRNMVMVFVC